jgi:predicted nucleic acid-binding protein
VIERLFTFLPDNKQIHDEWRQLIVTHSVSGLQVYDARIVAVMKVHAVSHLLTLNKKDFIRYPGISVLTPHQVLSGDLPV